MDVRVTDVQQNSALFQKQVPEFARLELRAKFVHIIRENVDLLSIDKNRGVADIWLSFFTCGHHIMIVQMLAIWELAIVIRKLTGIEALKLIVCGYVI